MRFFAVFPLTAAQCWFGKQLVNTMLDKKEKTIRATGWRTLFDGSDLDKWSVGGDEVTLVGDALTIAKGRGTSRDWRHVLGQLRSTGRYHGHSQRRNSKILCSADSQRYLRLLSARTALHAYCLLL